MNAMQAADVAPTTNTLNAIAAAQASAARVDGALAHIADDRVCPCVLNVKLKAAGARRGSERQRAQDAFTALAEPAR